MLIGVFVAHRSVEQLLIRFLRDEKLPAISGRENVENAMLKKELTHLITSEYSPGELLSRVESKVLWRQFNNSYAIAAAHVKGFQRIVDIRDDLNALPSAIMADGMFASELVTNTLEADDGRKYRAIIASLNEVDLEVLEAFAATTQPKKIIMNTQAKSSTVYVAIARLKKAFENDQGEQPTYDGLQSIAKSIFENQD